MAFDFSLGASDPTDPNAVNSPEQLARRQLYAEALMKQGADGSPVRSAWQGAARLAQGVMGALDYRDMQNQSADANKSNNDAIAKGLLGISGGGMGAAGASMSHAPGEAPAPMGLSYAGGSGVTPPANLLPHFAQASQATGIPVPVLVAQAKQESGLDNSRIGRAGEIGLTQIMPSTARDPGFGVQGVDPAALKDPATNIMFGAQYLAGRGRAAGVKDWNDPAQVAKALTAYNGGGDPNYAANVMRYMPAMKAISQQTSAADLPAPGAVAAGGVPFVPPSPNDAPLSNFAPIPGSAPAMPSGSFAGGAAPAPAPAATNPGPLDQQALQTFAQRNGMVPAPAPDPTGGATRAGGPANPNAPAAGATPAGPAPTPAEQVYAATRVRAANPQPGDVMASPESLRVGSAAYPAMEGSPEARANDVASAASANAGRQLQMQQIMGVLQNPYTNPAQRQVATMLLQRYMGQEQWKDATGPNGLVGQRNTMTGEFKPLAEQADQKWGVIGEDSMGRKIYGRPPAPGTQPAQQAPASSSNPDAINLHGEEFIKTLDPGIQTQVRAIVEGRAPYPTGMLLKTPYGQQLAQYVTQADPSFETGNANSRVKVRNEFNAGGPNSPAGAITAGNTAIQHLGHLSDAAEKLGNSDSSFPGAAKTYNVVKNTMASGKDAVPLTEFNNIVGKYVEEATKFYRGTGGTEADIQRDISHLNPNMTPSELHAAIKTQAELLQSKINALQDRWKQGMGPLVPDFPIVHAESAKQMETIRKRAEGEKAPAAAAPPAAPSAEVARPQSEAEYNALPPGASYIRPGETTPRIKGGK